MNRSDNNRGHKAGPSAEERRLYEEIRDQVYRDAYRDGYKDGKADGYHLGYEHATEDHHHNERAARQKDHSDMHWHGKKSKSWLYL